MLVSLCGIRVWGIARFKLRLCPCVAFRARWVVSWLNWKADRLSLDWYSLGDELLRVRHLLHPNKHENGETTLQISFDFWYQIKWQKCVLKRWYVFWALQNMVCLFLSLKSTSNIGHFFWLLNKRESGQISWHSFNFQDGKMVDLIFKYSRLKQFQMLIVKL